MKITGADRLAGYEKPNLWSKFQVLAAKTKPTNLGQGFPSWEPPKFFIDAINTANATIGHQYTRAYGIPNLVNAISDFYSPYFKRTLDPMTNILVANGGVTVLNTIFQAMLNPGDEIILLDPGYDCYAGQVGIAGGVFKSVPLKPKTLQSIKDIKAKTNKYECTDSDQWEIDYELLKKTFNSKTKAILINSPHNPTGKVFTAEEYKNIAEIVKQYDNCFVIEDMVYEHLTFDNYKPFDLPRMSHVEGMFDRCISVSSAGKLFSATGIRVGWAIGPQHLIKFLNTFHQFNIFAMHGPTQEAIAQCLNQCKTNGYFEQLNIDMMKHRNILLDCILEGNEDLNIWIPSGGYFILCDISNIEVEKKFYEIEKELFSDYTITKDLAYSFYTVHQKGILAIPCSIFFLPESKKLGESLVRYAFCKDLKTLEDAAKKFKN